MEKCRSIGWMGQSVREDARGMRVRIGGLGRRRPRSIPQMPLAGPGDTLDTVTEVKKAGLI